jgi:hypothetical protein
MGNKTHNCNIDWNELNVLACGFWYCIALQFVGWFGLVCFCLAAPSLFSGAGIVVPATKTDRLPRRQRRPGPVGLLLGGDVASGHQPVNLCQDSLEGRVDTGGVEGGCFDKGKVVLFRKGHGLVRLDRPQVAQIALVSDEHDDDVGLGVVPQFLQPPLDILEGSVFGNIVDQKGADGSPVVGAGDGAVAFLPCGIPDLRLDALSLGLDGFGGEFDPDRRFGFEVEFVSGESTQKIGFSDTGIPDQDNLEQIIVFFVNSCRHCERYSFILQ